MRSLDPAIIRRDPGDAGGLKLRTGLVRVLPIGAVLCVKETIFLDEWAGGRGTAKETDVGRVAEVLDGS